MTEKSEAPAAVYVSWVTFKTAIEQLAQAIPNRIDRSVFQSLSGGVQAQLLAGFKFLGLIADDLKPTPALIELAVPDEALRKKALETILRSRYSELFALELTKTTPAQLAERMAQKYSVGGDTKEKAIRFFLAAITYLDIPISKLFKIPKARSNGGSTRRQRSVVSRQKLTSETPFPASPATGGPARTVSLRGGGTLTVSATLDLFALTPEDRDFVFRLIDQLSAYESSSQPSAKESEC